MNYKLLITFAALALIFASCTNNEAELQNETPLPGNGKALVFTATMPDADTGPQTRIALSEDPVIPQRINVKWKEGDELMICLVQNTVRSANIIAKMSGAPTNDGKTARFYIEENQLPATNFNKDAPFDIYGLHNGQLVNIPPTTLPGGYIYLYADNAPPYAPYPQPDFATLRMEPIIGATFADMTFDVKMHHIGSFLVMNIYNKTADRMVVTEGTIAFSEEIVSQGGTVAYDYINGVYESGYTKWPRFIFPAEGIEILAGQSAKIGAWHIVKDIAPLEANLQFRNHGGPIIQSPLITRNAPLLTGRAYHFNAEWNGTNLTLTRKLSTGVTLANPTIYTWPGKSNDLGITPTPVGSNPLFVSWTQTRDNNAPNISLNKVDGSDNNWSADFPVDYGYHAANGVHFTLTGKLHNDTEVTADIYTRLNLWGKWGDWDGEGSMAWFNQGLGLSWHANATTLKVRAYYAKDATEYAKANDVDGESNLTRIPASEYEITSNTPAYIQVTKDADGQGYTLTRTNFDELAQVLIISSFGNNTVFHDKVTLIPEP